MNLSDILINSDFVKPKPKKHDVFMMLVDRVQRNDGRLEREDLIKLFAFFKTTTKTPRNHWDWLQSAASADPARPSLKYIYSDGNKVVATNGHILFYRYDTLPQGYYFNGERIEWDEKFPDVDRVIPEKNMNEALTINNLEHDIIKETGVRAVRIKDAWFDEKYIRRALAGDKTVNVVSYTDETNPILLHTKFGYALVMPLLRPNKEDK